MFSFCLCAPLSQELVNYKLLLWGTKTGNLEDGNGIGISYSNNTVFSTYDNINANRSDINCPRTLRSAWWFSQDLSCTKVNLNGNWQNGLFWEANGFNRWLNSTKMMMRRTS
ncbi:hypothetical protein EGW08_022960 [Elysia chlorotica]|uniref:Fibrinogen C-terminal domain-containing protein n=1 Tax=Elysia chlorotica TaxID=188477 RepID=A0A3S1AVB7_ELYCH|nr:hypothetical protein EGW08_022960 [Elysia chlorotica]